MVSLEHKNGDAMSSTLPAIPTTIIHTTLDTTNIDTSITADITAPSPSDSTNSLSTMKKSRHVIDPNLPATAEEIQAVRAAQLQISNLRAQSWLDHPGDTLLYFIGSQEAKFWRYKFEEIESLVEMFSKSNEIRVFDRTKTTNETDCPFQFAHFPSSTLLQKVFDRSISLRGAYQCYAKAQKLDDLVSQVLALPRSTFEPYLDATTYRVDVSTFAWTLQPDEKTEIRNRFSSLGFTGTLSLTNPESTFTIFVEYMAKQEAPTEIRNTLRKIKPEPIVFYFCREIHTKEPYHTQYDLRTRPYIGPTSTDAQLAFLMSNFCRIMPNNYVFDPFVGTGSLLIAAAKWGAVCIGQDLDWKVIHGRMKGKQHTIFDNFAHYNLRRPDLVCSDNSRPAWRLEKPLYDAIISDPPYGIRAGARRLGATEKNKIRLQSKKDDDLEIVESTEPADLTKSETDASNTIRRPKDNAIIPMTKPYPTEDVMYDLLHLAAKQLRVGGRLCYLLPVQLDFQESELPIHPCLQTIYNCEQILQGEFSRRAITVEKICEFDPSCSSHQNWPEEIRKTPTPRWAKLHDEVICKESGSIKHNGKIHMTRSEKRKSKEERLEKGLSVSNTFRRQYEERQKKKAVKLAVKGNVDNTGTTDNITMTEETEETIEKIKRGDIDDKTKEIYQSSQ